MGEKTTGDVVGGPWLTEDQLEAWRTLMGLVQKLPIALDTRLRRNASLSFTEYYVMALLADQAGERMRMSQLAARVDAELSRLSHMVSRLEKRGFLTRKPDPADGRYTYAMLTDEGRAYQRAVAPDHVQQVRELVIDALDSAELQGLRGASGKILARIEPPSTQRRTPRRGSPR